MKQEKMTIKNIIETAYENKSNINDDIEIRDAINKTLDMLDRGEIRICEQTNSQWNVNSWIKKAILLSFKINENEVITSGINNMSNFYDKVKLKFSNWNGDDFKKAGFRAVPGALVRHSAFIGKNVVLMPSFVNIGAYVDEGSMIDTWATVGSCAQIGKNCHISGGAGIGGVLEPLQANPVIIEDDCFIGARSEIAEGVIVRKGSVISMGVYIGSSTKIIDRNTGEIFYGEIPPYSVVVPGNIPAKKEGYPSLYAAVIVKRVDERTRSKTGINELLRD